VKSHQGGFYFWGFPWFFLALLLYLSIFGIRKNLNRQNDPGHISVQFQKEILSTEAALKKAVELLSLKFDTNAKKSSLPKNEILRTKEDERDIFLFAWKNDSLVYWNDNKVILPAGFSNARKENSFACLLKNGWYGFHGVQKGDYYFLGSYLIKNEYSFQNDFVDNRFSRRFRIPASVSITGQLGKYPVYSSNRSYLFSLVYDKYKPGPDAFTGIIFLLFILGSLSLFYFLFVVYARLIWFRARENLLVISYAITIVLLRVVQYYSGFPGEISRSILFSPAWYSSSALLPSLGDFALNAFIIFIISLVVYQKISINPASGTLHPARHFARNTLAMIALLLCYQAVGYFVADLVTNSSLSLNLQNISGLTYESGFGLFIISSLLFSLWFFSARLMDMIFFEQQQVKYLILPAVVVTIVYSLICRLAGGDANFTVTLFFLVYLAWYWNFKEKSKPLIPVQHLLFFFCFYAVFATYLLNRSNQAKETEKLNLLAVKLATRRNPVTEVLYEQVERRLHADSLLNQWISHGYTGRKLSQDSLEAYLKTQYFKDYWTKYQIQITSCDPAKELRIQPQGYLVNCATYFHGIIRNYGEATSLPNLFFLDYGFRKEYYLAVFSMNAFESGPDEQPAVFIEFNLKNVYPDPGYPGLLMDKSRLDLPNLTDYSYALFQNGGLVRAVGANGYKLDLAQYKGFSAGKAFFTADKMIHFQYRINKTDTLLISKREDSFLSLATPFPYLFTLFSLLALLVTAVINFPNKLNPYPASLRNRLHFSLIGILVLTMLAIGVVQVINIIQINSKKNVDHLREKAYSVVVEVQHKYGAGLDMQDFEKNGLEDFLVKLSNVFFTDINVYSNKGLMISSSRPQIFEEGLLSDRMNAEAYSSLVVEKNSIFIHHESIGSMQFNSAYIPFYSDHEKLLGFVNLPYFAKQDESKNEISTFLVTFINVYILLILFGVFITVLVSNYITAPLAILAKKMSQLRLGLVNEKIAWKQNDEIGQLVSEYNRMIDELARSADLLAKSERESAWRAMARQVAHEIKNPLTPMKLSAQYLEKAWNEHAPDWDQRLSRFTKTLVEQIDALSLIASDFSDFAKMPTVTFTKVNLEEAILFTLSLYQDTTPIRYEFQSEVARPFILADRSQLIRVFTNLLNNAVQAIEDHDLGRVRITIEKELPHIIVKISDNGSGIPPDRTEKIFQPDFTTKSGGMGLGLAIVKSIVVTMNGEITFTSGENEGTTFIIKFPVNDV
jgi:two-component system, NtrC family, nitrogen regulation sensor histidine kinase NtrY